MRRNPDLYDKEKAEERMGAKEGEIRNPQGGNKYKSGKEDNLAKTARLTKTDKTYGRDSMLAKDAGISRSAARKAIKIHDQLQEEGKEFEEIAPNLREIIEKFKFE